MADGWAGAPRFLDPDGTARMSKLSTLAFAGQTNGLFSTDEVDQLMRVEFERGQRYRYSIACMLIQVDHLGHIHNIHGWESREEILTALVDVVRRETRDGDLMGYLIEDRMMVLFPHTSERAAKALADRLLARARDLSFNGAAGTLRITLSIGISHNSEASELSFEGLKEVATEGLAVADASGGDRWAATELYDIVQKKPDPDEADLHLQAASLVAEHVSGEDPSYREILEDMVSRGGDLERAVASLVEQIMSRAVSEASEDMGSQPMGADLAEEKETEYEREIGMLRRRVAKLTESLGITETEIARLRDQAPAEDGVSSVYRNVQGLCPADEQVELKKALMESIFKANIDLQRTPGA